MTYGSKYNTVIGQGQNFNEYELVQNKYLKHLGANENTEQTHRQDRLGNNNYGQLS